MHNLSNDEVIHVKRNGFEYIQFKRLLEYGNMIKHAFTLKPLDFGIYNDREKYTDIVTRNYNKICTCLNTDYKHLVRPIQTHTNNVVHINKKEYLDKPDMYLKYLENVDGIITDKKNIILSTNSGDCILLLFFDPVKNVIANVHAGWQGTFKKIVQKSILEMAEEYNCDPKNIICCICPGIQKCHFEVDEDVKQLFQNEFAYTNKIEEIISCGIKKTKYHIDLVLINKILLLESGLKEENIVDSGLCSVCNKVLMHSYRGHNRSMGRAIALIELI